MDPREEEERKRREAAAVVPPAIAAPAVAPTVGLGPAGVIPVDTTTTGSNWNKKQTQVSEDFKRNRAEVWNAGQDQAEAIEKKTEAEVKAADAEAKSKELLRQQSVALQAQEQQREDNARKLYEQRMSQYTTEKESLDKAGYMGLWAGKDTGSKILAGIGVALGAFGAALSGDRTNRALATIEAAGERDYKIWSDRLAMREKSLERSGKDVEAIRAEHEVAMAARKTAWRQAVIDKTEAMVAATKSDSVKAAGAKLVADQRAKIAADDTAFAEKTNIEASSGGSSSTTVGIKPGGPEAGTKDLTAFDPDGNEYTARSPAEGLELREGKTALDSAKEIVAKLKSLNIEKGRLPDPALTGTINTEINNLLEKKKGILGSLTDNDRKDALDKYSTGLLKSPESAAKALDAFIGGMEGNLRAGIKTKATPRGNAQAAKPAPSAQPRPRAVKHGGKTLYETDI